jgi:hypothetical protein
MALSEGGCSIPSTDESMYTALGLRWNAWRTEQQSLATPNCSVLSSIWQKSGRRPRNGTAAAMARRWKASSRVFLFLP